MMASNNCQFIVKANGAPDKYDHLAAKTRLSSLRNLSCRTFCDLFVSSFRFHISPFCLQLCYFLSLSILGFLLLKLLPARSTASTALGGGDFDAFFMSVSAATVSSMSTVEMEAFSDSQLVVLTVLMLVGGEVFTSILELQLKKRKLQAEELPNFKEADGNCTSQLEDKACSLMETGLSNTTVGSDGLSTTVEHRATTIRYLGFAVTGYHVLAHLLGSLSVLTYVVAVPSARAVLDKKGIRAETFAVFTVVSSFTNCGFIPTNENMAVFKSNSGLLLMLIVIILLGNTLFSPCLRLAVWAMGRLTGKPEFDHMLKICKKDNYNSNNDDNNRNDNNNKCAVEKLLLSSGTRCVYLALTVVTLVLVQLLLFCSTEWHSNGLSGMSPYQKFVGALFQSVNSRHAGESILSLSDVSPAILVLYAVMMYLPSSTTFLPVKHDEDQRNGNYGLEINCRSDDEETKSCKRQHPMWRNLALSQLSYLCVFTIIICITEREKLRDDPLNFNAFNVMFEVMSAYGNVGLSTGYSCHRRLKAVPGCRDPSYGFVGAWSTQGKVVLVLVMLLGRLKRLTVGGGRAWRLR